MRSEEIITMSLAPSTLYYLAIMPKKTYLTASLFASNELVLFIDYLGSGLQHILVLVQHDSIQRVIYEESIRGRGNTCQYLVAFTDDVRQIF